MKKYLIILFLITISTTQIFAVEIIPKVGWIFAPHINYSGYTSVSWKSPEGTFSYGGDILFRIWRKLYFGPGVMFSNSHKIQDINDLKVNFTDIYLEAKLKFDIKHKDSALMVIYPFIHIGGSTTSYNNMPKDDSIVTYGSNEEKFYIKDREFLDPGLYYAFGCGIEYKSIVLEFLYGINVVNYTFVPMFETTYSTYSTRTYSTSGHRKHNDITYSAFRIQIGYKFSL